MWSSQTEKNVEDSPRARSLGFSWVQVSWGRDAIEGSLK